MDRHIEVMARLLCLLPELRRSECGKVLRNGATEADIGWCRQALGVLDREVVQDMVWMAGDVVPSVVQDLSERSCGEADDVLAEWVEAYAQSAGNTLRLPELRDSARSILTTLHFAVKGGLIC